MVFALAFFVPAGVVFLVCALVITPANRGRFLRRLGQIGKAGDEQQQAAAVAALVGGSRPGQVLELGASRFRTLPLDAIAEADLLTNQDTGLHAKTAHAKLGSADAFVSHSWHDDGVAKYAQLLAWARKFLELERSPMLWLDKACIDQSDIDANLACLPLFLSGCQELLVLPGATYPLRLWCVAHYAPRTARTPSCNLSNSC